MVKLQDPVLAKRYGIKTFPSLVYFRNGNPLTFDGKVSNLYDKGSFINYVVHTIFEPFAPCHVA